MLQAVATHGCSIQQFKRVQLLLNMIRDLLLHFIFSWGQFIREWIQLVTVLSFYHIMLLVNGLH